ncbi:hypothetical protein ACFO3D_15500 [Virgibacillus kekensis]|uniref:Uncharacterized protein n=1 Tax=Virgibacillus kekensis TaxID=202261 RepID=A0ABV9DPV8_9BACI
MLNKFYSGFMVEFTRLLLKLLFIMYGDKLKNKNVFEDIQNLMKRGQRTFIDSHQLNEDLTKGPVAGPNRSTRKLINAFVTNRYILEEDEQEFYLHVAKEWVGGIIKSYHVSLIFAILFIVTYLSTFFLHPYISGWIGLFWIIILLLSPFISLFSAFWVKGWKKWVLISLNIFFFITFIMIMA